MAQESKKISIVGDKAKLHISIDPELVNWIDSQIEDRVYYNRSHAIEVCIHQMKKQKEAEEKK